MNLKIISFNIGMGATRDDSNKMYLLKLPDTIPHLISFIKDQLLTSVDEKAVICLQEVDFNMTRSGNKNFLKALKASLGESWNYFYYDPTNETSQKYGIGIITNLPGTLPDDRTKEQKWKIYTSDTVEERGAIAIKLQLNDKFIWVVNTHVGFTDPALQINNIINRIYTFDPTVPVAVCGDFNVPDMEYEHSERGKNHALYQQTIKKLEDNGFFKSEITHGDPHTWHSWNSRENAEIVDYIMTAYPYSKVVIRALQCYRKVSVITPTFMVQSKKYYASDHNAIMMEYAFPE